MVIAKLILRITSDTNYQVKIAECSNATEVRTQTVSLLAIIDDEKSYNNEHRLILDDSLELIDDRSADDLDIFKSICQAEITRWLEFKNINECSLDIYLDKEQQVWQRKDFFQAIVTNPTTLIIKPFNFFHKCLVKSFFTSHQLQSSNAFFLEITLKLVLCNLLVYLLCEKVGSSFPVPEFGAGAFKDFKPEDTDQQKLLQTLHDSLSDFIMYITILLITVSQESFLMGRAPAWIVSASLWQWILVKLGLTIIINIRRRFASHDEDRSKLIPLLNNVAFEVLFEAFFMRFFGIRPSSYVKFVIGSFVGEAIQIAIILAKILREDL